ncbi:uncharacterized protein LOC100177391 [Ciona intestinalis]
MSGDFQRPGINSHRKSSRITFAGRGSGDGHLNIDDAGILQPDEHSRSLDDSVPLEDPSINLTDDDTFAHILEVNTASENEDNILSPTSYKVGGTSDSEPILDISEKSGRVHSADLRIQLDELGADYSEDFSKTTDSNALPTKTKSHASGSPHLDETESLTEFEEIERLIQANTAQDSDDDFSDIPEDLEKKILSGRISRGSNNSRRNSGLPTKSSSSEPLPPLSARSNKSSSSRESNRSRESNHSLESSSHHGRCTNDGEDKTNIQTLHHDTGYASDVDKTTTNPERSMEVVDENPHNDTQSSSESSQSESEHEITTNNPNLHSTMVSTQDELNERIDTSQTQGINIYIQTYLFILYTVIYFASEAVTIFLLIHKPTIDLTITQEEEEGDIVMEDTADTGGDQDHIMDRYIVPTHRSAVGDTNEPNSLVATFGTTEDFEVLLQQQLDEMNDDDIGTATRGQTYADRDTESPTHLNQNADIQWQQPGNNRQPTSKKLNSSTESVRRSSYTRPSPRNKPTTNKPVVKSRLKLSPKVKANSPNRDSFQPREATPTSGRNTSRSARSPAANRARRANDKTHGRESRLTGQSSDDASIRSDISRSELRSKLKEEAQSRKRDEEFVKQLQENYGELLMKYAEAENTIDHLRLGAKINIFASVPRPNLEDPTLPFEESTSYPTDRRPQHATVADGGYNQPPQSPVMFPSDEGPSKLHASSAGSDKDSWVESSLQLPAAAAAEFLRVALQLQAKDLQDKIDSFKTLMKETDLSPHEKAHAMDNIEDSLHALERDYLNAVDEHAAEQRKLAMATGGSVEQIQPFDPGREMESDIFRLGQMVDGLKHEISDQPAQQQQQPTYHHPSSPELDVEEKFDQLMKKYNRTPTIDEDTSPPIMILSSHDEEEDGGRTSRSENIPNKYFQPASSQLNNSTLTLAGEPPSQPQTPSPRKERINVHDDTSRSPSPSRRHSRLPRPVSRGRRSSSADRKQTDKGTDSGFVGSESSRQSTTTAPLTPVKTKLVTRPQSVIEVKKVPDSKPPVASERRGRCLSGDTTSTMQTNERGHRPKPARRLSSAYHDKVGMYKPPQSYTIDDSMDDISTTSTVREMLKPRHASRSISSSPSQSPHQAKIKPPLTPYPRGSRSGASVKSKDSSKSRRSMASSTKDSTLDAIRGEISKLREEMKSTNQGKENVHPVLTSTPRVPLVAERSHSPIITSDNEALRAIHDDIKALKDEVHRQSHHKGTGDTSSVKSAEISSSRRSRSEKKTPRSRRSHSLDRDDLSDASTNREESPTSGRRRRRSRSQSRNPFQGGYWTYVAPSAPVIETQQVPIARVYARTQSPVRAVYSPVYPTVQPPVVAQPQVVYMEPPTAPTRVYVSSPARTQARIYTTPSKPNASIYISPRHANSGRSVRKANVYIVDSEDEPLRRSHLSSLRRSSSMSKLHREVPLVALPDSSLNDSIEKAERASERLRSRSRTMYRTVRDDLYHTQLLADTM